MQIRPEAPDDQEAVHALIRQAFGDEGEAIVGVWSDLRQSEDLFTGLVADADDGGLAGHIGLSRAWVDARRELVEVGMLSPLGVRPDLQGQGIGAALVREVLQAAERLELPVVVLEGDPGYYSRLGLRPAADLGIEPVSVRVPAPAVQAVALRHEDWMTGRLVYPDRWWRSGLVGFRDPQLAEFESRFGGGV